MPLHHRPQQEALSLLAVGAPGVRALDAQAQPRLDGLVVVRGSHLALGHRRAVAALRAVALGGGQKTLQRHDAHAGCRREGGRVDPTQRQQGRGGQGAQRGLVLAQPADDARGPFGPHLGHAAVPVEPLGAYPEHQLVQGTNTHHRQACGHALIQPGVHRVSALGRARAHLFQPLNRLHQARAQTLTTARGAARVHRAVLVLVQRHEFGLAVVISGLLGRKRFERGDRCALGVGDGLGVTAQQHRNLGSPVCARQRAQLVQQALELATRAPCVAGAIDEEVAVPGGHQVQPVGPGAHEGQVGLAQAPRARGGQGGVGGSASGQGSLWGRGRAVRSG